MKQFEVLSGQHIEPLGLREKKTYTKGQIVLSEKNLTAMFPLKFKDLGLAPEHAREAEAESEPVLAAGGVLSDEAVATSSRGKRGKASLTPNE